MKLNENDIKPPYNNHIELINLIPSIQEAILKGLERDRKTHVYNVERVRLKAQLYKEIFKIIQGRWTIEILYSILMLESCNFNELKSALLGINSRTLTDRLRFLEKRGVVARKVLTASPIRVEYRLTDFGKETFVLLIPFVSYYIMPPSIKEKLTPFKSIENDSRLSIAQEIEIP